jgi:hypothetical protein
MEAQTATPAQIEQFETCEECGSPVDRAQRYCVVCGTRRNHVNDPAVRYLSGASGRTRTAGGAGTAVGSAPSGRRPPRRRAGVGTAIAIALVPIAVALGVVVGRAGNGTDAKLLDALRAQKAEVVNIQSGGAVTSASNASGKASKGTSKNGNGTGKALSKTNYGTFNSVSSLKSPSQATLNNNAAIVNKVQGQINKSYVNSQKNLPNVISVP